MPYNDDYFIDIVERAWVIKEDESKYEDLSPARLAKIQAVLREKVRQKTKTGHSEQSSLAKHFNFFDIDNSGNVIYDEFVNALKRLGVVLDDPVSRAFFKSFDTSQSGRISYQEFVNALYGESGLDATSTSLEVPSGATEGKDLMEGGTMLVSSSNLKSLPPPVAKVVFLVGGPCSGKSSQAARIAEEFSFVHLDVAYLLQLEAKHGEGKLADSIRAAVTEGRAVDPAVTVALISQSIEANLVQGKPLFVLDGFPRSPDNIIAWQESCNLYDVPTVIWLDAPEDVLEGRLAANGVQNADAKALLKTFRKTTLPLKNYFADARKLKAVSASAGTEQVYEQVRRIIRAL